MQSCFASCEVFLPASVPPENVLPDAEPRAFVLRVRLGHEATGVDLVVTVDDVLHQRSRHFANLQAAFAEIREALNQPGNAPGQPH